MVTARVQKTVLEHIVGTVAGGFYVSAKGRIEKRVISTKQRLKRFLVSAVILAHRWMHIAGREMWSRACEGGARSNKVQSELTRERRSRGGAVHNSKIDQLR